MSTTRKSIHETPVQSMLSLECSPGLASSRLSEEAREVLAIANAKGRRAFDPSSEFARRVLLVLSDRWTPDYVRKTLHDKVRLWLGTTLYISGPDAHRAWSIMTALHLPFGGRRYDIISRLLPKGWKYENIPDYGTGIVPHDILQQRHRRAYLYRDGYWTAEKLYDAQHLGSVDEHVKRFSRLPEAVLWVSSARRPFSLLGNGDPEGKTSTPSVSDGFTLQPLFEEVV